MDEMTADMKGKDATIDSLRESLKSAKQDAERTVRNNLAAKIEWAENDRETARKIKQKAIDDRNNFDKILGDAVIERTKEIEDEKEEGIEAAKRDAEKRADTEIEKAKQDAAQQIEEAQNQAEQDKREFCDEYQAKCDRQIEQAEKKEKLYDVKIKMIVPNVTGIIDIVILIVGYVSVCFALNYPFQNIINAAIELAHFFGTYWIPAIIVGIISIVYIIVRIVKYKDDWIYNLIDDKASRIVLLAAVTILLGGNDILTYLGINPIAIALAAYPVYIVLRTKILLVFVVGVKDGIVDVWTNNRRGVLGALVSIILISIVFLMLSMLR
jgi:hypothetical protein